MSLTALVMPTKRGCLCDTKGLIIANICRELPAGTPRRVETSLTVKNISSLIICNKTAKEERALTNNITSFLSDNIGLVLIIVLVLILLL